MNTSVVGHGGVRNGVVQTGAVALLLGAALAASGARAAENVERDDTLARPAVPAAPAVPRALPAPPVAVPAVPPKPAEGASERRSESQQHESLAEIEAKMRDAQERLRAAAAEVAALAAERAQNAMANFTWPNEWTRRTVIGVQLSSDGKDGAKVVDVSPGGPAELAGVRAGDVIVMLNGKDVRSDGARQVVRLLRDVKPESKVTLRVLRDGKIRDFEVIARPFAPNTFVYRGDPPPGPDSDAFHDPVGPFTYQFAPRNELAGLEVTTLTPQLGRYFGTDKGVLVVRAPKSDVFKLQDGDVIIAIDGREPTSGSHISRILGSYQPGEQLTLRVIRDRKSQDIVVARPDDNRRTRIRTTWLGEPM